MKKIILRKKNRKKERGAAAEAEKWRVILHNIEIYDGSGRGQMDVGKK